MSHQHFIHSGILNSPLHNKGTAFTLEERKKHGIGGLLPPHVESIHQQLKRAYKQLTKTKGPLQKYIFLTALQNRNTTLFYRLLIEHIPETMPLVYTPTVGTVCKTFGQLFSQTQGMYLSIFKDVGKVDKILANWEDAPDIIVVTDGSRILGLGDLGTNGMGIPIGKLSLYVAGAGFNPGKTLPITLDVGTNNKELLNDDMYLGEQKPRVRGEKFYSFFDEFMTAVKKRWPKTLVQFEDFSNDVCFKLLDTYRHKQLCFNDDIQGTGAVVTAGFLNAAKLTGTPIDKQRIVFLGAGSAAVGVATMLYSAIKSFNPSLTLKQARAAIYLVDSKGLVTNTRVHRVAEHKKLFSRDDFKDNEKKTLLEVIKEVKPTALIGLSGQGGAFTEEILKEVNKHVKKPIIFALSNPTSKAECSAKIAYTVTNGSCVFASGSPFDPVQLKGKTYIPGQGNNMYIFPGLGLGAVVADSKEVSEQMIIESAVTLANATTKEELAAGRIYPKLNRIRDISFTIAKNVAIQAVKEGLSTKKVDDWDKLIKDYIYYPDY